MPPSPSQPAGPDVAASASGAAAVLLGGAPAGPDAVLVFRVGPWRFGLPIRAVVEALPAARITELPDAPPGVEGYLDVRGEALPVVDLRTVLGLPTERLRPAHHFLVCAMADRRVILWVDRVQRLEAELRPAGPDLAARDRSRHVQALARAHDGIVLIQDLDALLRPEEADELRRALRALGDDGGDA